MKVSELAKELKLTDKEILATLKSLKLKSVDGDQVLNSVVLSVLRNHIKERGATKTSSETKKKTVKKRKLDLQKNWKEPMEV